MQTFFNFKAGGAYNYHCALKGHRNIKFRSWSCSRHQLSVWDILRWLHRAELPLSITEQVSYSSLRLETEPAVDISCFSISNPIFPYLALTCMTFSLLFNHFFNSITSQPQPPTSALYRPGSKVTA
jgi:hypothetical protein